MKFKAAIVYATSLTAILLLPLTSAIANHHKDDEKKGEKGKMWVTMYSVNDKGTGAEVGKIKLKEKDGGVVLVPEISGLTPGLHGFHVHENGSCDPSTKDGKVTPAGAAGSHLDLKGAGHHDAPWADGHTGDMPALFVDADGTASHPLFAPKLKLKKIKGKAIIIHAGGDNYSDEPAPLGGGGARVACGIIGGE